ncbi:VOC family protein [Deinococcus aquiradiocola]|uniref:VOC family protein n=1 Tax=Deinococcus aquiradiocola TaxID=393059 RepID=A0A917PAA7_9DEIO|nr:VOC family protein [Deinococcus aquiradiocola]GGJ68488.1 VOC family protein [Deinococcus aquiradiocola]
MFTLHPYLGFNGQAREALEFYRSCLGGTLDLMPVADSPVAAQIPAHMQDYILHGSLTIGPLTLSASDMTEDVGRTHSVTLALTSHDPAQARQVFDALAQGGTVTHPLSPSFWNGTFGQLTDRYGHHWMMNVLPQPQ